MNIEDVFVVSQGIKLPDVESVSDYSEAITKGVIALTRNASGEVAKKRLDCRTFALAVTPLIAMHNGEQLLIVTATIALIPREGETFVPPEAWPTRSSTH